MSARSCATMGWFPLASGDLIAEFAFGEQTQKYWMQEMLAQARERNFTFVVSSFRKDYSPIGLWTVRRGVLDPQMYSLLNTWACSGLYDEAGAAKRDVLDAWRAALVK